MTESSLTDALRAAAAGLYSTEAACELLAATSWPQREDFADFITTGTSISDGVTPMAVVNWADAVSALDSGYLSSSGAETRLLRLAASLGEGVPVDLQEALLSLDDDNIARVVGAIRHASGRRPAA